MLNFRSLSATLTAAVLVACVPTIAFSRPLSETSGYPVMPNSQVDSLVCYMETQEGQTLNLGRLCGEVPPANNATISTDTLELTSGSSGLRSNLSSVGGGSGSCDYPWQTDCQIFYLVLLRLV